MLSEAAARVRERGARGPAAGPEEAARLGFLIHDLRSALARVFAARALMRKSAGGADALLDRSLDHMRMMLERAYAGVRLQKARPALARPVSVLEAASDVAAGAVNDARRKGVTLSVRVAPRLVVDADAQYLESALTSLVQNAIKFTKPGGSVSLRGFEKEGAVVLEVQDQCGGLPGGAIDELFDVFMQKGPERSGLGLGLALARRAVGLNNGRLTARDIPGRGCVFAIALPVSRAPARRVHARRGPSRHGHNRLTRTP